MPLRIPCVAMRRGHIPAEWLVFFGDPSYTFMPVHGVRNLWAYIHHLITCQRCQGRVNWAPRGNQPATLGARRRYTRRVWGMRRWRRGRLNMTTGEREGRLRRVPDHIVEEGDRELPGAANNNIGE